MIFQNLRTAGSVLDSSAARQSCLQKIYLFKHGGTSGKIHENSRTPVEWSFHRFSIDFPMPNFFHGFPTELMTHWTPFLGTLCGKVAPWIQFHEEKKWAVVGVLNRYRYCRYPTWFSWFLWMFHIFPDTYKRLWPIQSGENLSHCTSTTPPFTRWLITEDHSRWEWYNNYGRYNRYINV